MISCAEFIPSYSELFTFLENKYGKQAVRTYWDYLFKPGEGTIPLVKFVEKDGLRGCWNYWTGTLNEEASDCTMYLDEKKGYFLVDMHHCPSKGRLLKLKEEVGTEPYPDYCFHCDLYRQSIEPFGYKYQFNCLGIDRANCSILVYDPKNFNDKLIVDEDTLVQEIRSSEREYFHRHFHVSLNSGLEYLAATYGEADIYEYLQQYTKNVYAKVVEAAREEGLRAIEKRIHQSYEIEKTPDAVETKLEGDTLSVHVKYCPAVQYLREEGVQVSKWYVLITEVVMDTLAKACGYTFVLDSYDEETGAAAYCFQK